MSLVQNLHHRADSLDVVWSDGESRRFAAVWLRDNIPSGRHREAGQRTFDITELPTVEIHDARLVENSVRVKFGDIEDTFTGDWLRHFDFGPAKAGVTPPPVLWDGSLQDVIAFTDYTTVREDPAARLAWLEEIRDRGFGLLGGTPAQPETIQEVVGLFGHVRETNYGRLFDVVVTPNPANLANTSVHIGMHTDNPYRDPVPGLQLLHCIVNDSDGGASLLCDGFRIAEQLRHDDPGAFQLLTSHPVRFRYVEDGRADIQSYRPLIELDMSGRVSGIRYNSRSAAAFDMPTDVIADFYEAYRLLGRRLNDPAARIKFRLEPGQLMIFDNQRVLHGRSVYQVGHRHLQGCYADKDALHSAIRVLRAA